MSLLSASLILMHTGTMQVKGREAAGSLHAGQSECSNMTQQVPLQPATTGPPSLEPAVTSHAVVAAAGPETPEQGPDLSAPVTAHSELQACIAFCIALPSLAASHASGLSRGCIRK